MLAESSPGQAGKKAKEDPTFHQKRAARFQIYHSRVSAIIEQPSRFLQSRNVSGFATCGTEVGALLFYSALLDMEPDPPAISRELLAAVKEGDESANRRLVEILYPAVQANVRNHLRKKADHEDVSQEIFLKIFLKIEQYRGPQPFAHWVARIAVTTCYDWLRKQRVRPLVTYSDLSELEVALIENSRNTSKSETSDTQRELYSGLLEKLIATLKPREQVVIRLLDLEENSVREIATLTGWGTSKIKVTAMRARRKLAEQIQQLEMNPRSNSDNH